MLPLAVTLTLVFLIGICLGSLVNWAIYALAWTPRPVSPWSAPPAGVARRRWSDRVAVVGWFGLSREAVMHGPRFWVRPMLLEVGMGLTVAALYWWEVERLGLVQEQIAIPVAPPLATLHWQFASHVLLFCLMMAAAFIDIDEKFVPDDITVPGTVFGLLFATLVPISLLPDVAERAAAPVVGVGLQGAAGGGAVGVNGNPLWLEPVTPVSPNAWPPNWGRPRTAQSLAIGLGCYWLWCFALAPRIWRGRRGVRYALSLIARRVGRELARPPLSWLFAGGTIVIVIVWWLGTASWAGLLTSLVGLAASGGLVWAVRLIGTAALRREAMGFGDVTFMMMVGTFLGWQACLMAFFLSPFAGLVVGILQFLLKRDDVIPYVPYLCLGSAATVVVWARLWNWAEPLFEIGWLVPAVLVICLTMLGVILAVWGVVKRGLFGDGD